VRHKWHKLRLGAAEREGKPGKEREDGEGVMDSSSMASILSWERREADKAFANGKVKHKKSARRQRQRVMARGRFSRRVTHE